MYILNKNEGCFWLWLLSSYCAKALETFQMSINNTVGKWSMVNPHNGVLHNNGNSQVTDMHKNMDESYKLNI